MSVGADDMIIRVGQSSPDLHVLCLMACLSQPHMSSEAIYTGEADASSLAVLLLTADTVTLQAPTLILMTYGQVSKPPVLALALRLHCQEVNRWRQVLHRDRLNAAVIADMSSCGEMSIASSAPLSQTACMVLFNTSMPLQRTP